MSPATARSLASRSLWSCCQGLVVPRHRKPWHILPRFSLLCKRVPESDTTVTPFAGSMLQTHAGARDGVLAKEQTSNTWLVGCQ